MEISDAAAEILAGVTDDDDEDEAQYVLTATVRSVIASLIATMIIEEALCIAVTVVGSDENKKTDDDGFQGRKTCLFIVKCLLPIVLPLLVGPLRIPEVVVVLILSILKSHPDTGA